MNRLNVVSLWTLAILVITPLAVAQEAGELRLRGRRLSTRESMRQTEIVLEDMGDELTDRVSAAGAEIDAAGAKRVDIDDLRSRTVELYAGTVPLRLPEVVSATSSPRDDYRPRGREQSPLPHSSQNHTSAGFLFMGLLLLLVSLFVLRRSKSRLQSGA